MNECYLLKTAESQEIYLGIIRLIIISAKCGLVSTITNDSLCEPWV